MAKKCKPFRVAVIGCVEAAEAHIAALIAAPETKLVAFCDVDKARVKEFRKKYKIRRGYTNYMRMLRPRLFGRIDAVHVCLPSTARASIAGYCLLKKRHVMIEPPMALDLAVAEDAIKNADYVGKNCGVLLPARANAITAYVKEVLASGRLGKILSARTVISAAAPLSIAEIYDESCAAKTAGGLLFGFAAPAIDLVDGFLEDEVAELSCSMANRAHVGEDSADSTEGVITYVGGVKHSFYCTSNYENGGSTQISLLCEGGEIVFDTADARVTYSDGTGDAMHDENPAMGCLDEVREFYTACREGRAPFTDARTALRLHKILFGLYADAMASQAKKAPAPIKPTVTEPISKKQRLWY